MKRNFISLLFLSILLISCHNPKADEYRIHGTVGNDNLEGVLIFLVPLHDQSAAVVDSVVVHDRRFEFSGHDHWMATVRVHNAYCRHYQDLLVVTEPGDIRVTIDSVSSGGGTPQNDSLQAWKERMMVFRQNGQLYSSAQREAMVGHDKEQTEYYRQKVDSLRKDFTDYTHRLAADLGEGALHDFLLKHYPLGK